MIKKFKAVAKNDCVSDSYYHSKKKQFKKGNLYSVRNNSIRSDNGLTVFKGGLPMCDVGSPFFNENFELIEQ